MNFRTLLIIPALICATAAFGQDTPRVAHADIMNAQGQKIGLAKIKPEGKGVKIEVTVSELPPGCMAFIFMPSESAKGRPSPLRAPILIRIRRSTGMRIPKGPTPEIS